MVKDIMMHKNEGGWRNDGVADDAGIETKIGCHTFRETEISKYLRNGRKIEFGAANGKT
jgi:hypothetical protein